MRFSKVNEKKEGIIFTSLIEVANLWEILCDRIIKECSMIEIQREVN